MVIGNSWPKIIDWRYQDSELRKPTTYVRAELDAEVRRVYDLIDSLFDKQGVAPDVGRVVAVAGGSLLDLRTRIRTLEARLVDVGDSRNRIPFRHKAVAMIAQYMYSEGPLSREFVLNNARHVGLTRVGANFAIDIGLDDKILESIDVHDPGGGILQSQ